MTKEKTESLDYRHCREGYSDCRCALGVNPAYKIGVCNIVYCRHQHAYDCGDRKFADCPRYGSCGHIFKIVLALHNRAKLSNQIIFFQTNPLCCQENSAWKWLRMACIRSCYPFRSPSLSLSLRTLRRADMKPDRSRCRLLPPLFLL